MDYIFKNCAHSSQDRALIEHTLRSHMYRIEHQQPFDGSPAVIIHTHSTTLHAPVALDVEPGLINLYLSPTIKDYSNPQIQKALRGALTRGSYRLLRLSHLRTTNSIGTLDNALVTAGLASCAECFLENSRPPHAMGMTDQQIEEFATSIAPLRHAPLQTETHRALFITGEPTPPHPPWSADNLAYEIVAAWLEGHRQSPFDAITFPAKVISDSWSPTDFSISSYREKMGVEHAHRIYRRCPPEAAPKQPTAKNTARPKQRLQH